MSSDRLARIRRGQMNKNFSPEQLEKLNAEIEKTVQEGLGTEEFEKLVQKDLEKKIEEKLIPIRAEYEKRKKDEIMIMKRSLEEEAAILRQNQNAAEQLDDIIQQNFAKVREWQNKMSTTDNTGGGGAEHDKAEKG